MIKERIGRVRQLDFNLEAEYALLGCLIKKGELIKEITLEPKHFYDEFNQIIFTAMRNIEKDNDPIDLVSLVTKIGHYNLKEIGGREHLAKLMNGVPSLDPYKTYEKYIFETWKLRAAKFIQQQEIHSLTDIDKISESYAELELENKSDDYDHAETLIDLYREIEEQEKGLSGIDTGFNDLNKYLDGFQNKELIISAARPSVGKTAKMLNHAIAHCLNKGITVIFSLEMDTKSLIKRLISTIGRIDGFKMKNPKQYFNEKDWDRYNNAIGILGDMNIHIFDKPGQTVPLIRSKVNILKRKYPNIPMLVQIDYLQLIRPVGRPENKNIEIGEITRSLKELAKDADVPVYLLSQLSRGVESRQDKRPRMSDIRESGSVEQDADVIEFLYRDDYYDRETESNNTIEIIIAKQRNGPVGTVELAYVKEYNLFLTLDYRHEN